MKKLLLLGLAVMWSTGAVRPPQPSVRTMTGWFSDQRCAREPKADEAVHPNGTSCVKECLLKGATPVFLSEQTNTIYKVLDHPRVADDVGYQVEVKVAVDESAKTVSIRSVKRLAEVTPMCLLPKKRG